jgi:hypothetical protein
MELKIVREGNMMPMMLSQNRGFGEGGRIHEDILVLGGRDTEFGWEDVFTGTLLVIFFFFLSFTSYLLDSRALGSPLFARKEGRKRNDKKGGVAQKKRKEKRDHGDVIMPLGWMIAMS